MKKLYLKILFCYYTNNSRVESINIKSVLSNVETISIMFYFQLFTIFHIPICVYFDLV